MMSRMTWKVRIGAVLVALGLGMGVVEAQTGPGTVVESRQEAFARHPTASAQAPVPWLQEDPGSEAYARAREALNNRRYQEAVELFSSLRDQHPRSGYVADSYYWQAFALSRLGGRGQLQRARALLQDQMRAYPSASTIADAEELMVQAESRLAQMGDAQAAQTITRQAQEGCGPEDDLRASALNALLNMNPDRAVPLLRQVLEDRDACSAELRQQAVFLISQKLDDESVDILLDLAHRNPDPDPDVREQAVFWLSQVRTEEAVDALLDILNDSGDEDLQENALFALSQHDSPRAAEALKQFAERNDVSSDLRENALFWIGQTPGGSEYLMNLWSRIQDPDLKDNILTSIAQNGGSGARDWLVDRAMDSSEEMDVRESALFWAGQSGAFDLAELRELFHGFDSEDMKEQVIFVASQRHETEAVDFLMEIAENPENGELRETAIFWLGQSDDPRVPEFLMRIIGR